MTRRNALGTVLLAIAPALAACSHEPRAAPAAAPPPPVDIELR